MAMAPARLRGTPLTRAATQEEVDASLLKMLDALARAGQRGTGRLPDPGEG